MPEKDLVTVTFSDGSSVSYPQGTPISAVAGTKAADGSLPIAANVNGTLLDLCSPLTNHVKLEYVYADSAQGEDIIRHSASHVMAQAVQELYPGAKISIGPAIENGFYYDFDYERPFIPEDLERIEKRMQEIIAEDIPITRAVLPKQEALHLYKEKGEPYKTELIDEIADDTITVYSQGSFTDGLLGGLYVLGFSLLTPAVRLMEEADPTHDLLTRATTIAMGVLGAGVLLWILSVYDAVLVASYRRQMS